VIESVYRVRRKRIKLSKIVETLSTLVDLAVPGTGTGCFVFVERNRYAERLVVVRFLRGSGRMISCPRLFAGRSVDLRESRRRAFKNVNRKTVATPQTPMSMI
jgi:hypothetical protein